MKLVYIGTYPPRQCGIGTFTQDLVESISAIQDGKAAAHTSRIIAVNNPNVSYNYGDEVCFIIDQQNQQDYLTAASYINNNDFDICVVQHEFGIYGGDSGIYLLALLNNLEIPFLVTLHTILKVPSYNERAILIEICKMASRLVVMSSKAVSFLTTIYGVPENKIALIEHGVPDIQYDQHESKELLQLAQKKVLLTFGFVGRNKGIETVIKALPEVVKNTPDIMYIVAGKTHPNVLREVGEEYREYLERLVEELDLAKHVLFLNKFMDIHNLFRYLAACDIYLTPYLNEAQITSGTLTYAMGSGCAVVSTPYWHAAELLQNNNGQLFNFADSEGLSKILIELLNSPKKLKAFQERAAAYGANIKWPNIGSRYAVLAASIVGEQISSTLINKPAFSPLEVPKFSLAHVNRLTDHTGILQHAKYGIPNLKEGYCLDDNARALIMCLMAYKNERSERLLELMAIYLSYIHYMQKEDGTFKNFLSFSREFLDDVGSEDSFGRAIWALGYLLRYPPNDAYFQTGKFLFFNAASNFEQLNSIRSIANTIIGLCHYLNAFPEDLEMLEKMRKLTYKLANHYKENQRSDWMWFEALLAYDNGLLPLAMLHAAEILHEEEIKLIGIDSMLFLTKISMKDGFLSVVGNKDWYKKDGEKTLWGQQPVDAQAMVLMYQQAYKSTKDQKYLDYLNKSFMWFLGENDLRMSLYDSDTSGCCDGFEHNGINRNQGAESLIAYMVSHLTTLEMHYECVEEVKSEV